MSRWLQISTSNGGENGRDKVAKTLMRAGVVVCVATPLRHHKITIQLDARMYVHLGGTASS